MGIGVRDRFGIRPGIRSDVMKCGTHDQRQLEYVAADHIFTADLLFFKATQSNKQ